MNFLVRGSEPVLFSPGETESPHTVLLTPSQEKCPLGRCVWNAALGTILIASGYGAGLMFPSALLQLPGSGAVHASPVIGKTTPLAPTSGELSGNMPVLAEMSALALHIGMIYLVTTAVAGILDEKRDSARLRWVLLWVCALIGAGTVTLFL